MASKIKRIKQPDFPYKTVCDICVEEGVPPQRNRKRPLWSYWNPKKERFEARCKAHLKRK